MPAQVGFILDQCEQLRVTTKGYFDAYASGVDPYTGHPPQELISLSITGGDLTTVDALATATFAMRPDARPWFEQFEGIEAFAVTTNRQTWATTGFPTTSSAQLAMHF